MSDLLLLTIISMIISFVVTFVSTPFIARAAKRVGIVGVDLNKKGKQKIPELGGIAITAGIVASILFVVSASSFLTIKSFFEPGINDVNIIYLLAVLSTILIIEIVGFIDDILGFRKLIKFILPLAAALPLMAVKIASDTSFSIPFIGDLLFVSPAIYIFILIPLGVTVTTNLINTYAGFNGLEAGTGSIIAAALLVIGLLLGKSHVIVLSAILLGSLLAFFRFNLYPASIFPNDVGTLLIGAVIACIIIIGSIETAGVILLLPHIIDLVFFKIPNRLPDNASYGILREGKLYCPQKKLTLFHWIMGKAGGITERNLVLILLLFEAILAIIAISIYI